MNLNFKINKNYALLHAFQAHKAPFEEWKNLEEKIKSRSLFKHLRLKDRPEEVLTEESFSLDDSAFEKILKKEPAQRLIKETQEYKDWLKEEWNAKKDKALKELKDISGLELPKEDISVYLTHPKLHNGLNIPEANIICWGHPENWENYSVVYLCHELLHIMTHGCFEDEKVIHALVELATDNELRIRLNGGGEYFEKDQIQSLEELEKEILPLWKDYLAGNTPCNDILELEKEILKKNDPASKT